MQTVDMNSWPRRKHFEHFSAFDYPHFNMCANVDVTSLHQQVKKISTSFTVAVTYVLACAANSMVEFRYRIREENVIEHEVVHPSITIITGKDLFSFCSIEYNADFQLFGLNAQEAIEEVINDPNLEDEPGQDDLLFMSAIPWVAFTSISHPIQLHPVDSVPRMSWGKVFENDKRLLMPLSVQAHHGLMDGLHMGRYFQKVQKILETLQPIDV
ncbi:MAG: chloramphenicol acetyltransferase [Desulfobacterales bacterium]|nr:chloramphenicol acetyltransferase [Desulfobacterales bacterium]